MKNFEKYKTYKEREAAFQKFCSSHENCPKCPLYETRVDYCSLLWIELEAEEEKPLPCPLCGARMGVHGALLKCTGCKLTFAYGRTTNDVTSAFNRIAKAVMESGNEGDK